MRQTEMQEQPILSEWLVVYETDEELQKKKHETILIIGLSYKFVKPDTIAVLYATESAKEEIMKREHHSNFTILDLQYIRTI